jgi:hypothetical protein
MCVDVDVDEVEWKKRENKRRWMGPLEEIKRGSLLSPLLTLSTIHTIILLQ